MNDSPARAADRSQLVTARSRCSLRTAVTLSLEQALDPGEPARAGSSRIGCHGRCSLVFLRRKARFEPRSFFLRCSAPRDKRPHLVSREFGVGQRPATEILAQLLWRVRILRLEFVRFSHGAPSAVQRWRMMLPRLSAACVELRTQGHAEPARADSVFQAGRGESLSLGANRGQSQSFAPP